MMAYRAIEIYGPSYFRRTPLFPRALPLLHLPPRLDLFVPRPLPFVELGVSSSSLSSKSSSSSSPSPLTSTDVLLALLVLGVDCSCSNDLRSPRLPRVGLIPRVEAGEERGSVIVVSYNSLMSTFWSAYLPSHRSHLVYVYHYCSYLTTGGAMTAARMNLQPLTSFRTSGPQSQRQAV